jgi:hypothetical protein
MEAHPKNFEGFVDTERPFDHYLSVMRQRGQFLVALLSSSSCQGKEADEILVLLVDENRNLWWSYGIDSVRSM